MNDYQRVCDLVKPIIEMSNKVFAEVNMLISKNQNRPPLGDADGSFTEETWTCLSNISRGIDNIKLDGDLLRYLMDRSRHTVM
jgi:hypothetical protein